MVESFLDENLLEMKNLYVEVSGKRVLEDVNLWVLEREVHVLFGPNGSGKSSLINGHPRFSSVQGYVRPDLFQREGYHALTCKRKG